MTDQRRLGAEQWADGESDQDERQHDQRHPGCGDGSYLLRLDVPPRRQVGLEEQPEHHIFHSDRAQPGTDHQPRETEERKPGRLKRQQVRQVRDW